MTESTTALDSGTLTRPHETGASIQDPPISSAAETERLVVRGLGNMIAFGGDGPHVIEAIEPGARTRASLPREVLSVCVPGGVNDLSRV